MKNFFSQIFKRIEKLNNFTNDYLKISHNIEIPALAYTNWGMHLADTKDFKSAITAVLMSNQNPRPCLSLGVIYAKLKKYKQAEEALKKAIERDSQNAFAYSVLASVLTAVEKYDEAEINIKNAVKLAPNDYEVYLNYGVLLAKLKKKDKAVQNQNI